MAADTEFGLLASLLFYLSAGINHLLFFYFSYMNKSILISGATGLIGKHVVDSLVQRGDSIVILTQNISNAKIIFPHVNNFILWNELPSLYDKIIDGFINLAGTNLGAKRWTKKFKKEIYDSRINTTRAIIGLIQNMKNKPDVLINASGVDYYGSTGDRDIDEDSPSSGSFISGLVKDWEQEALEAEKCDVRVVLVRAGFVIASGSKALAKMILPFKLFAGGYAGPGKQFLSWIDIEDITAVYLFCLDNTSVTGPVNAVSPSTERMKDFSKYLGKALHRPCIFRVPSFLMKILFGEASDLILTGRKALPKKLLRAGFKFKYENALDSLKKEMVLGP